MVKIINGEIVQDDDPRLRRKPVTTGSSSSSSNPTTRIASLLGGQGGGGGSDSGGGGSGPAAGALGPRSPLDMLAAALKIEDKTISIPAIPQLKFTASVVPLVYFIPAGFILMMFGLRGVVFILAFYALFKHSQNNEPPP